MGEFRALVRKMGHAPQFLSQFLWFHLLNRKRKRWNILLLLDTLDLFNRRLKPMPWPLAIGCASIRASIVLYEEIAISYWIKFECVFVDCKIFLTQRISWRPQYFLLISKKQIHCCPSEIFYNLHQSAAFFSNTKFTELQQLQLYMNLAYLRLD